MIALDSYSNECCGIRSSLDDTLRDTAGTLRFLSHQYLKPQLLPNEINRKLLKKTRGLIRLE